MKIIGIAGTHAFGMKDRFKDYSQTYVNQDFITSVIKAGAIPIILPINQDKKLAKEYIAMIDGLILTGGKAVNPKLYGQEKSHKTGELCPSRDVSDSLYVKEARAVKKPILGICRGMQLLNVIFGGTLYQDISFFTKPGDKVVHDQKTDPGRKTHKITIKDGTMLKKIFNKSEIKVSTFHHQMLKDIAPDFETTGFTDDNVVEAIEYKKDQFILGVQWHPEMLASLGDEGSINLFKTFIKKIK